MRACSMCGEHKPADAFYRQKGRCKGCMNDLKRQAREAERDQAPPPPWALEGGRRLPMDTGFREWITAMRDRYGSACELAAVLEVEESTVHHWLRGERRCVTLGAADAVLCKAGEPTLLREFWPFLYEELEELEEEVAECLAA